MATAPSSGLLNANNPLQAAGPSFFNQNPRQLSGVVLYQGVLTTSVWTILLPVPRAAYITIQDIWVFNRAVGANFDCYLAMVASGSAFDPTSPTTDQDDVFQFCAAVPLFFRDELAKIVVNPKQQLWAYPTKKVNIHLSGLQVSP